MVKSKFEKFVYRLCRTQAPARLKLHRQSVMASVALSAMMCTPATAELSSIWALDDGTKVKATDLRSPLQKGNGVFTPDPLSVRLMGARNEIVAFQLILAGGNAPTLRTGVEVAAIGPIANRNASRNPHRYFIGRNIELFLQHYHTVTHRSAALTWKPGSAAQPRNLSGEIPDALIPLDLMDDRTFTVAANRNQGVWIDIHIPRQTPAGKYRGNLRVTVDGSLCGLPQCTIPLELDVIPATLPEAPTTKTMLWFSGANEDQNGMLSRYFPKPDKIAQSKLDAMRARHFKLARRHRVTLFIGREKLPSASLRRRMNGTAFKPEAGYAGPGEGVKQDLASIHTYGGELSPQEAKEWHDWLAIHAPHAVSFLYVRDEPAAALFPEIKRIARRALPIRSFVTTSYKPELPLHYFGNTTDSYRTELAEQAKQANRQIWVYNGVRPFSGTFMIDDVAVSPRVNPWIQYKHAIPRWFYWEATYYNDFQGGRGQIDVWNQADNFSNRDNDRLNGDGLLFWPGRDFLFPKSDRGINAPLPSIRLKNWRRGIQDVEYLVLARTAGHGDMVDQLISALLPTTLDQAEVGAPVSWPENGEKWLAARKMLADAIAATAHGRSIPALHSFVQLQAPPEPALDRISRKVEVVLGRLQTHRTLVAAVSAAALALLVLTFTVLLRMKRRRPTS